VLERNEHGGGVGLVAAPEQVEAVDHHHVLHARVALRDLAELTGHLARALERGTVGQLHVAEDVALVFRRDERGRNAQEQSYAKNQNSNERQEREQRMP
jgi:hypothetical protein